MSVNVTLHYVYDPLCGWCYGASPLISAAREVITICAHAGGMMAGNRRQRVTPQLRDYVIQHDERIARLTGQPFGQPYRDGLLRDTSAVFDSEPPTTAVLAAEQVNRRGLDLLARIQRAHFVEGRRVADESVLRELAAEIGIEPGAFERTFASTRGEVTQAHIAESRKLLVQFGGAGFPTIAIENRGRILRADISSFLGYPIAWREWLNVQLEDGGSTETKPAQGSGNSFRTDGR
jgi:putative protein-disulfide isomerase